jgi:hypothetical protein
LCNLRIWNIHYYYYYYPKAVVCGIYWSLLKVIQVSWVYEYDWNIADFFPVRTEKNVTNLHVFLSHAIFRWQICYFLSFSAKVGQVGWLHTGWLIPPPLCIPMHLAKLEDFARERWIMLCPIGRLVSTYFLKSFNFNETQNILLLHVPVCAATFVRKNMVRTNRKLTSIQHWNTSSKFSTLHRYFFFGLHENVFAQQERLVHLVPDY